MVVKEDGTKWACQSCLKGHRVSQCTHTDRELTLVPKKGRPVTQCHHCRLERKKRSAHVKCDCGETDRPHHSKEKCIHLREAEVRAKSNHPDDQLSERDPSHLAAVAEEQGCCCHHGGKCACALLKKEATDSTGAPHGPAVKPRLEKTTSDGAITVFTNGHHKPVHRKNHAAHECGMPYRMPMARSSTEQNVSATARRSVDSLALDDNMQFQISMFSSQTSTTANADRQQSKSVQHSPKIPPTSLGCHGLGDARLSSIDFSTLAPTQTNSTVQSNASENYFSSPMEPMSGLADESFSTWSAFPSADSSNMPNNNPFGVWPTCNDCNASAQPALTAASSGTQSEIDEMPQVDDIYGFHMPSIQEDADNDVMNLPPGNPPQLNRRSLPPDFFANVSYSTLGQNIDWQTSSDNFENSDKVENNNTSTNLDDAWQMPALSLHTSVAQRALGTCLSYTSRPQSRSVGSSSAPNDDLIKQLFPEIDLNSDIFAPTGSPQISFGSGKPTSGFSRAASTSAPMDFRMDETIDFATQTWSDGSMSVPNDTFNNSYDFEQDFSDPDFAAKWPQ